MLLGVIELDFVCDSSHINNYRIVLNMGIVLCSSLIVLLYLIYLAIYGKGIDEIQII